MKSLEEVWKDLEKYLNVENALEEGFSNGKYTEVLAQYAKHVTAIDVSEECTWTECFVIGTVSSVGHLRGVVHQIWDEINEIGLSVNNRHKSPETSGWELIDCGDIVIHLMSAELREFYNLEKLWKATENLA